MTLYQHTCSWLCVGHVILGVSSGSCRRSAPSTSCLAFACCCCSSRCSGCSSAVRGMCPPHARTAASLSSRHARPTHRRQRRRTTLRGVLTSWPSLCRSESASRSCWCSSPSCTRSSTRRRSATSSWSSTRWTTTGEPRAGHVITYSIFSIFCLLLSLASWPCCS